MAKKRKANIGGNDIDAARAMTVRSKPLPNPVIPTDDPRHMSHIRNGRISFEVFDKRRRAKLPRDLDVIEDEEAAKAKKARPKRKKGGNDGNKNQQASA